jgi:hypothetical protein
MASYNDGSIIQSVHLVNQDDYGNDSMNTNVLGIVLEVFTADHPTNRSAIPTPTQRGARIECRVLIVQDYDDRAWIIPNAVVLPTGPTGIDDFSEHVPRPTTQMIDGSTYDGALVNIDYKKLDGDWCVVSFIGGSTTQPYITGWWPHPSNFEDATTGGVPRQDPGEPSTDTKVLNQGRRMFRRFRGTKFTITSTGSLYLDTNESNSIFSGTSDGIDRKPRDDGGDIQIDVKPARQLQVNFNPSVALGTAQPSLPQPNPPAAAQDRETKATTVTWNKKLVEMIAGEVVRLITNDKNIEIFAKTKVTVKGDDGNDSVILGSDDPGACDHAVIGETFMNDRYNKLVAAFNNHMHNTAVGPTAGPTPSGDPIPALPMSTAQLSPAVKVKK